MKPKQKPKVMNTARPKRKPPFDEWCKEFRVSSIAEPWRPHYHIPPEPDPLIVKVLKKLVGWL